ncbi:MAG: glycosyltransferase family 39 protein [Planctomycetota bacterium]|jgi:hypothetical protein
MADKVRMIRKVAPVVCILVLFAFYLATRPAGIHVSDSYAYANTVEEEAFGYFFHPHHALYAPLAWRWTKLVRLVLPGASAWSAMSAMSAAFGCAGIAALYVTLLQLGARRGAAAVCSFVLAVLFGYWFFSTEPEVYIVSGACALWAMYFLSRFCTGGPAREVWWAGICAGFAAAFHQTGIFLFVPACVVALLMRRQNRPAPALLLFTLAFLIVVVPAYVGAFIASGAPVTPGTFLRWIFLFGAEGYGGLEATSAAKATVGFGRSIVGGQAVLDVMRGSHVWTPVVIAGAAMGLVAVCALGVFAARALKGLGAAPAPARVLCLAGTAGFAIYAIFSVYFDPANFEWWTIPASLLWLAMAALLSVNRPVSPVAVLAVGLLLAGANLALDFQHRKDPRADVVASAAREVIALTDARDVIVAPSFLGSVLWYHNRDRTVYCPDKAARVNGPDGSRRVFAELVETSAREGGRVILAALEADAATHTWVQETVIHRGAGFDVVGRINFFRRGDGWLTKVAESPVLAARASEVITAVNPPAVEMEVASCR